MATATTVQHALLPGPRADLHGRADHSGVSGPPPPAMHAARDTGPDVEPRPDQRDPAVLVERALVELRDARDLLTDLTCGTHERLLDMIGQVEATATALRSQVLAALADSGTWAVHGDRDLPGWVARTSRQGPGAAFAQVRDAQALAAMPQVADALADGHVTTAHVGSLARVTATASPQVAQVLTSPEGQAKVVQLAKDLDARRFATELKALAAKVDPAKVQRDHDQARAERFLLLADVCGATVISGRLDQIAGKTLRLALEAVGGQPPTDDTRTREQRAADALTALVQQALDTPPNRLSAERPHVSLVVTERTWTAVRDRDRTDADNDDVGTSRPAGPGSAAALTAALDGHDPVRDLDGTVWPSSELGRLLCDCELTRMVLNADGQVLDVGRTVRLYTGHQRRTVLTRDGGCAWPGCTIPARYTEIHHMDWWHRDGGATSVDRGVALCSFHHHETHRRDLTVERLSRTTTGPAGQPVATYQFRRRDGSIFTRPPDTPQPPSQAPAPPPRQGTTASFEDPACPDDDLLFGLGTPGSAA